MSGPGPDKIKVELTKAIPVEGEDVKTLELLTEPTAGDLRVMDAHQGTVAKTIALIAHLAQIPPSSVEKMSAKDFTKVGAIVTPFIA